MPSERRNGVVAALAGLTQFDEAAALVARGYPLAAGQYTVIGTFTDDAKAEKCKANAEDLLVKHADLACLVGLWEYNPPQLLLAVKEAKKQGQVKVVGFDENVATLQAIRDGHCEGTIVQQPFEFGYQCVKLLAAILRGDAQAIPADGVFHVPHKVITLAEVDAFEKELQALKGK